MRAMAGVVLATALIGPAAASPADDYRGLVKAYFDSEWKASPVGATSLGVHDGDALLDDVSAAANQAEAARLHASRNALAALDATGLAAIDRDDRDVLVAQIDGQLLEDETVQLWRHNPATYVDLMTTSIYQLIERDFAPLPERLRSVIAREQKIPAMLEQAKRNLVDMPPVFIDVALENLGGADSFFGHDVKLAFAAVTDDGQKAALERIDQGDAGCGRWLQGMADGAEAGRAWQLRARPGEFPAPAGIRHDQRAGGARARSRPRAVGARPRCIFSPPRSWWIAQTRAGRWR